MQELTDAMTKVLESQTKSMDLRMSEKSSKVRAAVGRIQRESGKTSKGSTDTHLRRSYSDLGDVLDVLIPLWEKETLDVFHVPLYLGTHDITRVWKDKNGKPNPAKVTVHRYGMRTRVYLGDEWMETTIVADSDTDPKGYGSLQTYLRRYSLTHLFQLVPEDDDGTDAVGGGDPRRGRPPSQREPRKTVEPKSAKERAEKKARTPEAANRFKAKQKALGDALLEHTGAAVDEAQSWLQKITKGKDFDGFSSVKDMSEEWQLDTAIRRFTEETGVKVEVKG